MPTKLACFNYTPLVLPIGFCSRLPQVFNSIEAATNQFFGQVNVVMVQAEESRRLNQTYRRQPRVTDVLSFVYTALPPSGEIIICLAQAQRQARRRRWAVARELNKLVIHGALHMLGYDHIKVAERKVMRVLETKLLNRLKP